MRAARPVQQAEAPHERGERDDDDLAFGELFDALRSRLVPSVGTTDAHAEKATIDGPRLDAARARVDQSWTARLEGDARERHERRLASIRASLARVARRRDAFGDRVRASLARVSLEEDALASDSAARAEATAVRAESVAGAWRAETLGSAATEEGAPASPRREPPRRASNHLDRLDARFGCDRGDRRGVFRGGRGARRRRRPRGSVPARGNGGFRRFSGFPAAGDRAAPSRRPRAAGLVREGRGAGRRGGGARGRGRRARGTQSVARARAKRAAREGRVSIERRSRRRRRRTTNRFSF